MGDGGGPAISETPVPARPSATPWKAWLSEKLRKNPSVTWLGVFIVLYAGIASFLAILRLVGFYDENWDMGIFEQALWTTGHHGPLLWEAGDRELIGVSTFFQVHPSLMMFPLTGLYYLAPSPVTLLVLQALVTALAAAPLYLIAKHYTGSQGKSLLTAGIYLVWVPVLSANLYDFHLEAFLPLELFTFFYLWLKGRYLAGGAWAFLSFVTLEIAPVFVFFFLVFFYFDYFLALAHKVWAKLFPGRVDPSARRAAVTMPRNFRWGLLLAVASVLTYVVLRLLSGPLLWVVLGYQPAFAPAWGFSAGSVGLGVGNLPIYLSAKVTYWFMLYALLAFVPLLRPRAFLLALPWLVSTFFSFDLNYVQLGYQYGYLAAIPLMLGFAYGIDRVEITSLGEIWGWIRSGPSRARKPSSMTLILAAVVVVNILLSPVDPVMQASGIPEGVTPAGYWLNYQPVSGYSDVQSVVRMIEPANSTVLASDDLFPFVANNPNAYTTLWYPQNPPYLPFNTSNLPQYILLSRAGIYNTPTFLQAELYNQSDYGVRATVGVTPVGPVTLFERGYHGAAESLSPLKMRSQTFYGSKVYVGDGRVVPNPDATYNYSVESVSPLSSNLSCLNCPYVIENLWFGPFLTLYPGTYTVTISIRADAFRNATVNASTPALWVDSSGFDTPLWYNNLNVTYGDLHKTGWATVSFDFTLSELVYSVEVRGYVLSQNMVLNLNYINIAPT